MVQTVENGRLYLPAPDETKPNERNVMHPETNADQVIMDSDGETLREFLGPQIVISESTPKKACIWGKITATRV